MSDAKQQRLAFFVSKGSEYMTFQELPERKNDPDTMFPVSTTALKKFSDIIRDEVKSLCKLYLRSQDEGVAPAKLQSVIERIALNGGHLRREIFCSSTVAKRYGEWIESTKCKVSFVVDCTVPVHAPYGLMFGGPDSPDAFDACRDYRDEHCRAQFWREKHGVSVVYTTTAQTLRPADYSGEVPPRQGRTRIFGIFNREALNYALERKETLKPKELKWPKTITANSAKDFMRKWPKASSDHNILYFFCHADGENLMIGNSGDPQNDNMIPNVLWSTIEGCEEKRKGQVGGLVVLNGCQTAVFSGEGMWLKATRASGFDGFIGTESIVPTKFAWPFGNDLLNLVASQGRTPLEAMQDLWEKHWPLSILYNLYCVADARISRPVRMKYLDPPGRKNHSLARLGDGRHATLPFGK